MKNSKILVTVVQALLVITCNRLLENKNNDVYGIDNLNNYYDIDLKYDRLKSLKKIKDLVFTN